MKIVVTGSLGHISKPLTSALVAQGHSVTVISNNSNREKDIQSMGATAAIGSVLDTHFLVETFRGNDAVYCMIPPNFREADQVGYYRSVGECYANAVQASGIPRVIELSSYGAHLDRGTGFIVGSHQVEQLFNALPGILVVHLRPGYFYYNLLNYIPMIKGGGIMAANHGGEDKLAMVSPLDIAQAAAEELVSDTSGIRVRYIVSDDRSCTETAQVLGAAIGKPDLTWIAFSDEQMKSGLTSHGVPDGIAANLVELGSATHSGILREEYDLQPNISGTIKLEDFAKEFAAAFNRD